WTSPAACGPPTSSRTGWSPPRPRRGPSSPSSHAAPGSGGARARGRRAAVGQPPTSNREEILAAIDRFQVQRGTAIGSGILVSLKIIFPDIEFDLRSSDPRPDAGQGV